MIPLFKVFMPDGVTKELDKVLKSGYIGQGKKVEEFEKILSDYIENPFCLTTNSGTSAIHLALRLCDLKPGDEVISTPMTCSATNEPIMNFYGVKIVWADIYKYSGNINMTSVISKITPKTKAIIVVHWGGDPVNISNSEWAVIKYHKIKVIEDACHALGSLYLDWRMVGNSDADFVCFSFQAIKEVTTGDGGALFCKDKKDYDRGKLLRWFGIDRNKMCRDIRCEKDIKEWGYKFHMNDIQATIGIEGMKTIESRLMKTRDNAKYYIRNINPEIFNSGCNQNSSFWLYTGIVKNQNKFFNYMMKKGIHVSCVHSENSKFTCFKEFKTKLPGVEYFDKHHMCIPVGWWLKNDERNYIVKTINEFK